MEVDSNSDMYLLYDKNNIYEENTFKIYFYNMNSRKLDDILNGLNIRIIKYIVDDKIYYARSISELEELYFSDFSDEEQLYYKLNGIIIDGIYITCDINELIKLDNISIIY